MTDLVFVDSNVFVYAHDPRDAIKHERARRWLEHLWRERRGRTSVQVLSEFYVAVTRKLKRPVPSADAWEEIRALFTWRPLPIDEGLITRAREIEQRFRLSWWDSLVVAAAQLQECGNLLTEDLQDGQMFGTVTVRSPFTFAAHEPRAQYAATATATPRHESRGRPRRVVPPVPSAGESSGDSARHRPEDRISTTVLPEQKLLERICRRYRVKRLGLFGSAARGDATSKSDVDLMVEFEPDSKVSLWDMPKMQAELSLLFGGKAVDLVPPEVMKNPFRRKTILRDLRVLYET